MTAESSETEQPDEAQTSEPSQLPPLEPDRELLSWEKKSLDSDKTERR